MVFDIAKEIRIAFIGQDGMELGAREQSFIQYYFSSCGWL